MPIHVTLSAGFGLCRQDVIRLLTRFRIQTILVMIALTILGCSFHAAAAADDPEVQALIAILKDPAKDTAAKGEACLKLMDMPVRARAAVPALIPLLQATDQDMRDFAITTLKTIGPAAAAALPALRKVAAGDASPEIRGLAQDAVAVIGGGAPPDGGDEEPPPAINNPPIKTPPDNPHQGFFGPHRPAGKVPHDLSAMVMTFPELAKMPAPAWLKPGFQFTFYSASATIAGEGPVFQLDPQGDIWADDGSGRRYSMKPGGRITNDLLDAGHSGHGFAECTVVGVSPDAVAVAVEIYTIAGAISAPRLSTRMGFVGAPGCTGDLWVHPAWLAKVKAGKNMMYQVSRMPYSDGGAAHRAVAFAANDGSMVFIYDEATGVLLYRGGSGEGEKGISLRVNGQDVPNTPTRMLTLSKLLGQRIPELPWGRLEAPDWVNRVRTMRFAGDVGLVVAGSPNIPLPLTFNLAVQARGDGWVRCHLTQSAGGVDGALPTHTEYDWMAGQAQLGGLWIAPDALGQLRPGQVLDRNADTQFVTAVKGPVRTPNGGEMTVISRTGTGQTVTYGYDRKTGMLAYIEQQDRGLAGSMVARAFLQGWE